MSDLLPDASVDAPASQSQLDTSIERLPAREVSLGQLKIRRVLPVRHRRVIGPWCFFDR
jgi:hypothetical protein